MLANRRKVVAILGATCTGKSDLAIRLSEGLGGEIVNADSMQVYRHFDIGTAKPDLAARERIPHHVIDVAEPDEQFNAAMFQKTADRAISEISSRGAAALVVGGTGLYLRVLFHGLFAVATDSDLREELRSRFLEDPLRLYEELRQRDPEYAAAISPNDRIRVVRALEISRLSGITMSEWQKRHGFTETRYDACKIGLARERDELYRRIDRRVDLMLERGWVGEVEALLRRYPRSVKPFQSIGYREIVLYLAGEIAYREMVERIKTATRHYAKRQITWFSKEQGIEWHSYPEGCDAVLKRVRDFLG
ncbi:MAG: tRNA (adenosine(37)-N6)-dimethylallyltransferase MiaA [Syntrophorhabdales bacterium]|jgi:tRNA dimethylallyltransferase